MPLKEAFDAVSAPQTFACDGVLYIQQEHGTWCAAGFDNPRPYLSLFSRIHNQPVASILPNAFKGCNTIYEITLREGVKEIGKGAFDGCTKLRLIRLPASLTHIAEGALPDLGSKLFEDEQAAFWAAQQSDPWARKEYGLYDPIPAESKPGEIWVVRDSYAEHYCHEHGIASIAK